MWRKILAKLGFKNESSVPTKDLLAFLRAIPLDAWKIEKVVPSCALRATYKTYDVYFSKTHTFSDESSYKVVVKEQDRPVLDLWCATFVKDGKKIDKLYEKFFSWD